MIKSKLIIRIIVILVFALLIILISSNRLKGQSALKDTSSFRIYYRKIDLATLKGMKNYELNIVEGSFFDSDDVFFLHSYNSKVVGYYSVMEIGDWDTSLIDKLVDDDYLKIDGKKVKSLSGSNYIGDISSSHFQDALIKSIDERIMSKKMDGVFLDTVDWIDYYKDNPIFYNKLLDGYEIFLNKLKDKYPSLIIIQNRGFDSFEKVSYKYIDGLLWENFSSPYLNNDSEKIKTLENVAQVAKKNKVAVFTISFDSGNDSRTLSNSLNWIHLQSQMENRYSKWDINTN